jgi:hypothetical protein
MSKRMGIGMTTISHKMSAGTQDAPKPMHTVIEPFPDRA